MKAFKQWLLTEKYQYLGQCDSLRRSGCEEEWQKMMAQKKPISKAKFASMCDSSKFLDDDETLNDFVADHTDIKFYKSMWGNKPCCFIQTAGFEFVFSN